ncbi:hypothetical protein EII12_09030 [Buchananella hordeovulneris]|uniref:Uncharacterized protein n=1 Tax=Buchananella hordeovulneris TaxID=52770 RepID=A0A1Q5PVL9_9ACTO|nr:hypothetical protein [Buchananella hordeovulneris]OKL51653.1 hypothetical protein BSZ40_05710 [Buchananella hordeovulneris]RRD50853.1 hypothetical protein EII12_09030 [Buchananella hordeovulneris]
MQQGWRQLVAATPWESLEHAYGSAEDLPPLLTAMLTTPGDAVGDLWAAALHQGTIYSATAPVVEALARQLREEQPTVTSPWWWFLHRTADSALGGYTDDEEALQATRAALAAAGRLLAPGMAAGTEQVTTIMFVSRVCSPTPAEVAAWRALAQRRPADELACAAAAALTRHGQYSPTKQLPLDLTAALARFEVGDCRDADAELVAANFAAAERILPLFLADDEHLTSSLAGCNPQAALAVLSRLPQPDYDQLSELLGLAETHPLQAARACTVVAQHAARLEPAQAIELLTRLPRTAQLCDRLVELAGQTSEVRVDRLGVSHPVADVAYVLAEQGDARWEELLVQALVTSPVGSALSIHHSGTGGQALPGAFADLGVQPGPALVTAVRQVLRQEVAAGRPEDNTSRAYALLSLLRWIAQWPPVFGRQLRGELAALADFAPADVAELLAAWGEPEAVDQLRMQAEQRPALWLSVARASQQLADWRQAVAHVEMAWEGKLLAEFPDGQDPVFLAWCRQYLGDEVAASHPGRADQVQALRRLVEGGVLEQVVAWRRLRELLGVAQGCMEEACELACHWLAAGQLTTAHRQELVDAVADVATHGRLGWDDQIDAASRLHAARTWLELTGHWPGEPELAGQIIVAALPYVWLREAALEFARRLPAGPARTHTRAALQTAVDRPEPYYGRGTHALPADAAARAAIATTAQALAAG